MVEKAYHVTASATLHSVSCNKAIPQCPLRRFKFLAILISGSIQSNGLGFAEIISFESKCISVQPAMNESTRYFNNNDLKAGANESTLSPLLILYIIPCTV